jgi:uncharacterized protein YjbJ (UPF0337 family)
MNWKSMEGGWERIKADIKGHWDKLTDHDLEGIDGQRARLAGRLRELYGLTAERAEAELRDWERHHEPLVPGDSVN